MRKKPLKAKINSFMNIHAMSALILCISFLLSIMAGSVAAFIVWLFVEIDWLLLLVGGIVTLITTIVLTSGLIKIWRREYLSEKRRDALFYGDGMTESAQEFLRFGQKYHKWLPTDIREFYDQLLVDINKHPRAVKYASAKAFSTSTFVYAFNKLYAIYSDPDYREMLLKHREELKNDTIMTTEVFGPISDTAQIYRQSMKEYDSLHNKSDIQQLHHIVTQHFDTLLPITKKGDE